MEDLNIGLVGAGTVGGGVIELIKKNKDLISSRIGRAIVISGVAVRDIKKPGRTTNQEFPYVSDWKTLVNDPKVDIIIELMGDTLEAEKCILSAIAKGKHIVTANKSLLATTGSNIFSEARKKRVHIGFEAAVAGTIPIVKVLKDSLAGNRIREICGIINGTCNYILSSMESIDSESLDNHLKEAQKLGFAEADPTLDIQGIDAGHKLALMGHIAFNTPLDFDLVHVEGIMGLEPKDIQYALRFGYRIKLLATAKYFSDTSQAEMRVQPTLISQQHMLSRVSGCMNAITVLSDAAGETLYYGAGAGASPTASAVVSDIIEIARTPLPFIPKTTQQQTKVMDIKETISSYYLRIEVVNKTGTLASVSKALAENDISIEAIQQMQENMPTTDLVILTHAQKYEAISRSIATIEQLTGIVSKPLTAMPIERLQ